MDPLSQVQAGTADVNSPPVDVTGLPTNTPADQNDAVPAVDPSQLQEQPLNDGQPMGSPPTAQAQPPKPAMWKNVLRGALAGMELGGGIGAVEGAVDPNAALQKKAAIQTQRQAQQHFASLQSAHEYLTNSILQHQMSQWPESLQLSKAKVDAPIAEAREKNGWRPVAFGQGVGDQAMMAVTQQLKQLYPKGIPAGMQYLWTSDGVSAYDPSRAGAQALIEDGNLRRVATGQPPMSYSDLVDKNVTTPAAKTAFMKGTAEFWSPTAKGANAVARYNSAKSLLAQYQGYDALNQKLPADTPQRDQAHERLQDTIGHIQAQMDQARKDMDTENNLKAQLAERAAGARGKAYAMWRPMNVIDPTTNQAKVEWAFQAVGSGAAPLAEGAKLESKGAQISDIATGAQNLREDVQKLQNPFSDAQLVSLTAAMRQTDDTAIKQIVDANLGPQQLSPDQEQYVTDLLNLHERAMALRSVAGIGNQGSDAMRAAIVAMLPQPKDTPDLAMRKLDRFDQQISVLSRGIPSVKGSPAPGSTQQPQNKNATPQTHAFSVSAWMRANPKGNAAAARAAAQKAGFKVVP